MPRIPLRTPLAAAVALGLAGLGLTAAATPASAALPAGALFISEIAPDNAGSDNFEYIEVQNTTSAPIDLAAEGIVVQYAASSPKALTTSAGAVVPANGVLVMRIDYTVAGGVDVSAHPDEEFRSYWAGVTGAPDNGYPIAHLTGQDGIANAGNRTFLLADSSGTVIASSLLPTRAATADKVAQFTNPASGATATLIADLAAPTPGVGSTVTPVTPTDPTDPTDPADPGTPPAPQPDPALHTTPLQITELQPDSRTNVPGTSSDAYEFIELYNATDRDIDLSDYTLTYLYPETGATADWPFTPADAVIPSGKTVVLWIKSATNAAFTADQFNAEFGSTLTEGVDLLQIDSAGMANSGARGIQVTTKSGIPVSTALFSLNGTDDAVAGQPIQYGPPAAGSIGQTRLALGAPTPGKVDAAQIPSGLMVVPADGTAPVVADTTPGTITPGSDFAFAFTVTDDVQVKRATLELTNSADSTPALHELTVGAGGTATYSIPAADLTGKKWFDYVLTVSDGSNHVTTTTKRVLVEGAVDEPLSLNLTDGRFVAGTTPVSGIADALDDDVTVSVDGADVTPTRPDLGGAPVFAFEASGVNTFFRNGVLIGDDILTIFDEGIPTGWKTIPTTVPLSYVAKGKTLTVSVWAGTKAAPELSPENNDDFEIRNPRLVLPNGHTLTPSGYTAGASLKMGDSAGKLDFYDAVFTLPDDAFTARTYDWDTTKVADGAHTVSARTATDAPVSATVNVDNTAPAITTSVENGKEYRGAFAIDASIADAGSGIPASSVPVITLDGEDVRHLLPISTSSVTLPAGTHVLHVEQADAVGNRAVRDVTFTTPVEQPTVTGLTPGDGTTVKQGAVRLGATVADPSGDRLTAEFRTGEHLDTTSGGVTSSTGTTSVATEVQKPAALSTAKLEALAGADGVDTTVSSDTALPYQLFDVTVPAGAGDGYQARLTWTGSANAEAKVLLYVKNVATGAWEEVDRHITAPGGDGAAFTLTALVGAKDHAKNGVITALVQHSEGYAGGNLSTRDSVVTPANPGDTPRSDYDFTIGWESDTQYYNENKTGVEYQHQIDIHDYFLQQRENINLQYVVHTGDIVDNSKVPDQWTRADAQYDRLDAAGLPYGVLAGNHDVNHKDEDYTEYSANFGEARFGANPWYGGGYQDNRGHYDLVSADGLDFLFVYMGWGVYQDQIDWMNEVLAQYPERIAVIDLHEYLLTTGGLGPGPQAVYDQVVATNPNVRMVMSGHYHDAYTRVDGFDDDGDGTAERKVYQMLFDYQGLQEGGMGFLRLLQFDNEGRDVTVRTYSPSLDQYDTDDPTVADDPANPNKYQEFTIPYSDLNITPRTRVLSTDSFTADILGDRVIGASTDVASGSTVTASWTNAPVGTAGWYVRVTDQYGAVTDSPVQHVTVTAAGGGQPGGGDGGGQPGGGDGGGQPGGGDGGGSGSGGGNGAGDGTAPAGDGDSASADADGSLARTGTDTNAVTGAVLAATLVALGALALALRHARRRRHG